MVTPTSSKTEIQEYQRVLQRAGRYLGPIDGIWGSGTQRAHEAYTAAQMPPGAPQDKTALDTIRYNILSTARHFLNLSETAQNARWDDLATAGPDARAAELRAKLLETGWQVGWAYCAAFADVCWRAGYAGRPELALVSRSITLSAMGTFENFQRLGHVTRSPLPGALMLMQHGDTYQGHAGIVVSLEGSTLTTIEGNTFSQASSREGDGVYQKTKTLSQLSFAKSNGLWLRGFVNPFLI